MAKATATSRTVIRYMPAKKKRRSNGFTLPVALIAGFTPLSVQVLDGWSAGGFRGALKQGTLALTGFNTDDSKWYPDWMKAGFWPIVLGATIHWGAKKLGLNRALGRAGVPVLRV